MAGGYIPTKKIKSRSTGLSAADFKKLYFNFEVCRKGNLRADKKLEKTHQDLRKELNLKLLQHEMEFQLEKSKQLDIEEQKILIEKNEMSRSENSESLINSYITTKPSEILKVNYHGYISEPGARYVNGRNTKKIKDNDIIKKKFALTDNWMREENLKLHRQEMKCKKMLKNEKITEKLVQKKLDDLMGKMTDNQQNWLDVTEPEIDMDLENDHKNAQNLEIESRGSQNDSEEEPEEESEESKKINQVRDNFLRLYFKYDSKQEQDVDDYLKYHDAKSNNFNTAARTRYLRFGKDRPKFETDLRVFSNLLPL